ncbi:MAG: bifunctional sterol desaturase/short chain dehydrogenase [Synechococcaceae cyanobacterium SM2_3_2]|nr:bifunctional sterol desaturase/short chain dehydrogenase [Synechococcaceae cyanobacterium SM2_3_2]
MLHTLAWLDVGNWSGDDRGWLSLNWLLRDGFSSLLWLLGSLLLAEITRDILHWLAHRYPTHFVDHYIHHRVFRKDLTVTDPQLYRQSQLRHDVPESLAMMVATALLWGLATWRDPAHASASGIGVLYAFSFLIGGFSRGQGLALESDLTHRPGAFASPPSRWFVNRTYHWRHHFDDPNAYYCGTLTLLDRVMGTSLSLKGKTVAVTGSSGTLGKALLKRFYAQGSRLIALTSGQDPVTIEVDGNSLTVETIYWQVGQEQALQETLQRVDILVINHGTNPHDQRSPAAIQQAYEVNTFSAWRLLELFLTTVKTNADIARKEVWVNTSEAEIMPAFSPLYELSKRALGDLVTLRRLDAPCVIRKVVLGPFKSTLNPIGILSADWVAGQIIGQAKRDWRTIIVTIYPYTFILIPWQEFWKSLYYRLFSRSSQVGQGQGSPVGIADLTDQDGSETI